ncbi:hypothetical protein WN943_003153 [Citrus x changshan-huyou]
MTTRETLDFSARFQGVGNRVEITPELIKREKETGIIPDEAMLGLDFCADTLVGDAMRRDIPRGQKKRLITEGKTLYLGLCQRVPELFESYGFRCPERKAVADFLQDASSFA